MPDSPYLEIGGVDVAAYITAISPTRAYRTVRGTCPITLMKAGGGLTIGFLARVKYGILNGAGHFIDRPFQGFVAWRRTYGTIGTNWQTWELKCVDVNAVGTSFYTPILSTFTLAAANYDVQMASLVAQVQASYGATFEGIDATTFVPNLYPAASLAAITYEGGHCLNWYIEQQNARVYQLSGGGINPGYYYDSDPTAGPSTYGGVCLILTDDSAPGASTLSLSDTNNTILRAYERIDDCTAYFGRQAATYAGGLGTTQYVDPAGLENPFCEGGWVAPPLQLQTTDAGAAFAACQAAVLGPGYIQETFRPTVNGRAAPGTVIDTTLALEGWAGVVSVVGATTEVYRANKVDQAETELTAGVEPRRLNEEDPTRIIGRVTSGDIVPPTAPATAPTVVSDVYDPVRRQAVIVINSVSSISLDVAALRLRYVVGGATTNYSLWIPVSGPDPATLAFPLIGVAPATGVVVDVQARDTSGNAGYYGPNYAFTSAAISGPPAPTGLSLVSKMGGNGYAKFVISYTAPSPAPDTIACDYQLHGGIGLVHHVEVPGTATPPQIGDGNLTPGAYYDFSVYSVTAGVSGTPDTSLSNQQVAGGVPLPITQPPDFEGSPPDEVDTLGVYGWTPDPSGGGTISAGTANVLTGSVSIRISV